MVNSLIEYDRTDPCSIEAYAKKLVGKSFKDVIEENKEASDDKENKKNKGNLGQIIEYYYFHYDCNSDSKADFYEAGIELKVSPYKVNANGTLSAKERLVLTMIDYFNVVNEKFEESHLWNKSKMILLIYYLYQKDIKQTLDYKIKYSYLFIPPEQDIKIIKNDYEIIVDKIRNGKAHELSEGDTMYLGACTKAATSADRRKQPFSNELAKPRAFSFKSSYMTYVLNNYVQPGSNGAEQIVVDNATDSFEDYVVNKVSAYCGYTINNLCSKFEVDITKKPKNLGALLAYRILGIKGNKAEEFEKANIVLKTIRVGKNGKIKESMSFPAFKFKELVKEEWEDSTFGNYLRETRFFFVVFKVDKSGELRLIGSRFWHIPYDDLEKDVKCVWKKTVNVLKKGLKIENYDGKNHDNFPKATENRVCHVRPHAQNASDTYELPDGRMYPKQCFWLNNTYVMSQIRELL